MVQHADLDHSGVTGIPDLSAHTGDTSDAHDASAVSFDATGLDNTSATEVQAALEDFDAAITAAGGGSSAFIGCRAVSSGGTQNVSTATFTAIAFAGADAFDTHGFHDPASNNSRMTIPSGQDGFYLVIGHTGQWDSNATSMRQAYIRKNGSVYHTLVNTVSGNTHAAEVSQILSLVATDYVELVVYQESGGTRTVAGNTGADLMIAKLGT